ncbi:HlyD family secretion protein [Bacteroidota bacterium]
MIKKILNFKQTYRFNWYTILWLCALLIILYLFSNWHIDKQFIGIVERKSHQIGAQESGKIQTMLVAIGEQVKKDQVLAMLDISDLTTQLGRMKKELAGIQEMAGAQRDLYSINAQRVLLQLDNEASELMDRLSQIEAKSTELVGLNNEIERLKNAEKAGLGYSRDLSSLIMQRDALASYLHEQSKDVEFQKEQLEKTRKSRKIFETTDVDSISKSLLIEQMEYTESLQREVAATEHRINLRTILAPCDGYITELLGLPGDIINAFDPVIIVEELKPRFLDVYIPESSTLLPEAGMKVEIFSSRNSDYNTTGLISFVHPGFAQASERVSFRGQVFWARKVRVELPSDHQLIPGEVVTARLVNNGNNFSFFSALASENSAFEKNLQSIIKSMTVPDELMRRSRFEPSGIAYISSIGKYLIVSDDTGIQNTQSDHSPTAFLMDENGNVEKTPVQLTGIEEVNDLEAVASAGENIFYLVSSQNLSKNNKRPLSRELILKIKRIGEKYIVLGEINFLSLLLNSYSRTELINLGLEKYYDDGKPVLNIEGASFHDGALYLGLKEPVSKSGAIIWKLEGLDDLFDNRYLKPQQLSLFGYVDLSNNNKNISGISDLTFDHKGVLWILSTLPGADKDNQNGGLHRINRFADGRLEAINMLNFPGLKPEGICEDKPGRLVIVFDNDNEIPAFCHVDTEGL